MAVRTRVQMLKDRYGDLESEKRLWYPMYQLVGEYVMTRKQNFQVNAQPGEFMTEQLFSSFAPEAARSMASALVGNLWPNGARSFCLCRPGHIADGPVVKAYYRDSTKVLIDAMDAPKAGLTVALDEYMFDQVSFGVSGVGHERTNDLYTPIKYRAYNVKNFLIDENADGLVDTIYIDDNLSARVIVDLYGLENVSERIKKAYEAGQFTEKFRVVHVIEPRRDGKLGFGNRRMPIASLHFEWDSNKILRESGYDQLPVTVARMLKALGERYGRSPAMFAMPAILRLNLIQELIMRGGEKRLAPPLYLLDNGALGASQVDTSPNGLTVFNVTGMGEKAPVGQLFDVGDSRDLKEVAAGLEQEIARAFLIDRLMDLNSEKQARMTLGEAQIRDRIRGEGLSSIFRRQEMEMFSPLINASANILFDMGLLGVVKGSQREAELRGQGYEPLILPDVIVKAIERGQRIFDLKYISPAHRIMQTEELQGMTRALDIGLGAAQAMPDIIDNFDPDVMAKKLIELTGADDESLRDSQTVKAIREIRNKQLAVQAQTEQAEKMASTAMKGAQAQSMMIGAINDRPRG